MAQDLDDIDRKLLAMLQEDGRTPQNELARAVNLAVSSVNERVKKLLERGVITGIHAHVSPEALGLDLLAFVFVRWSDSATEKPFLDFIAGSSKVMECHHVTGSWNYLTKVQVRNTRALEAFLGEMKNKVPGLQSTETLIALSSTKQSWRYGTDRA